MIARNRQLLYSQVGTIAAATSLDAGVFNAAAYSRLTGIVKVDSVTGATATLQFRFQASSGSSITTSTLPVNSGGTHYNVSNEAPFIGMGITPVQSASLFSLIIFGETIR
jgi:hypothetical protein